MEDKIPRWIRNVYWFALKGNGDLKKTYVYPPEGLLTMTVVSSNLVHWHKLQEYIDSLQDDAHGK